MEEGCAVACDEHDAYASALLQRSQHKGTHCNLPAGLLAPGFSENVLVAHLLHVPPDTTLLMVVASIFKLPCTMNAL